MSDSIRAASALYLIDERASEVVDQGARAVVLTGLYVAAFGPEFLRSQILTADSSTVLELTEPVVLAENVK